MTEKSKSLQRLMEIAREIEDRSLPIKCLEAVVLAIAHTREITDVIRFPLRFRSRVKGQSFWHIVLALKSKTTGKFGALGLSRRPTLDFKELKFDSLSALVEDYLTAYDEVGHTVRKIMIGLPGEPTFAAAAGRPALKTSRTVGRVTFSHEPVFWHFLICHLSKGDWPDAASVVDIFGRDILSINSSVREGNYVRQRKFGLETFYDATETKLHFLPRSKRELRAKLMGVEPVRKGADAVQNARSSRTRSRTLPWEGNGRSAVGV